MSNYSNDVIAEDLFSRLETWSGFMNIHEYADKQKDLLRLLADGEFEEAQQYVLTVERNYKHLSGHVMAQEPDYDVF